MLGQDLSAAQLVPLLNELVERVISFSPRMIWVKQVSSRVCSVDHFIFMVSVVV